MSDPIVQVVPKGYVDGDLSATPAFERLSGRLDELGSAIDEISHRLRGRIDGLLSAPPEGGLGLDGVSLKFTLQFQAEAGVIVARASTAAGFEVDMAWKRPVTETT